MASELRLASVPVVDDLSRMTEAPDLIHGHHHLETMTALLHFPSTPALHFCHGFLPWQEEPLVHPRIHRYVAVDDVCRDRLTVEHGIPWGKVDVLPNFVDTTRFHRRPPLPLRPRRALVFENLADEAYVAVVREACGRTGMDLDVVGAGLGRPTSHPERLLGDYDVVFATGRSALEALATGCAVVICHLPGVGPLVTSDQWQDLRRLNFGLRALRAPLTADAIAEQMTRYDARDAGRVTDEVRETADLSSAADRLLALYARVLDAHRSWQPAPEEGRTASAYLRRLGSLLKEAKALADGAGHLQQQLDVSQRSCAEARQAVESLLAQSSQLAAARDQAERRAGELARRVRELTVEATRHRLDLERVHYSRTWRWTAPVRDARRRMSARVAAPAGAPAPFIVGVPRSGTTLMRMMLLAHPELAIPPETGFLTGLDGLDASQPGFEEAFADHLASLETWPDLLLTRDELRHALAAAAPTSIADAVRVVYRVYAERCGKSRWGDKTPSHALHLDRIRALLPEARFIHVIRDGRDVACSLRGLWFAPGHTMRELAQDWRDRIERTRSLAAGREDYLEIRYETLILDSERRLRTICEFLSLRFDRRMLSYEEQARQELGRLVDRVGSDGRLISSRQERAARNQLLLEPPQPSRIGRWRNTLSPQEIQDFESVAGPLLEQLGYSLSNGAVRGGPHAD